MAEIWEVQSTTNNTKTAVYKVDGTTVATITGLSSDISLSGGSITGIDVEEGFAGGKGTITLKSNVLTSSAVKLSSSKYTLALDGYYPQGEPDSSSVTMTFTTSGSGANKSGVVTLKGDLKANYKLGSFSKNAQTISYTAPKTNQTLAKISGLSTDLVQSSDSKEVGTKDADGNFTAAVTLDSGVIKLKETALAEKNATFSTSNGATYSLALDGVSAPVFDAKWDYSAAGKAIYKGTVTTGGYRLSLDGKTIAYTAKSVDSAEPTALVTVTGVKDPEGEGSIALGTVENSSTNDVKITLPASVLNKTAVSVAGVGYELVLGDDVAQSDVAEEKIWVATNGKKTAPATAVYKNVKPEYYTYNSAKNTVSYTAQGDVKIIATVSGLARDLTVGTDETTDNSALFSDENAVVTIDGNNKITLQADALTTSNVTLKNGTGENCSLDLADGITAPGVADGTTAWTVKSTTATLKGTSTEGWSKTNDTTITYVADDKSVVLATVKGLKSGVVASEGSVGYGSGEDYKSGLTESNGIITVSANVLGTTDVTLTPGTGYKYSFELDLDTTNEGGEVQRTAADRKFWNVNGTKLILKQGKSRYYTLAEDGQTIEEHDEVVSGTSLATVSGLKTGLKVVDGDIAGITVNGNNIVLEDSVLNEKAVTLKKGTGTNASNLKLTLANDNLKPQSGTGWDISGTTATLKNCESAGYKVENDGSGIKYVTRQWKDALATVTGLKSGLKEVNGEITGITVDENKAITIGKSAIGTTDIELDSTGIKGGYSLENSDSPATVTNGWSVDKKNNAVYTVDTTKAGVEAVSNYKLAYKAKAKVTTTISGLKSGLTASNGEIEGISGPDANGVITLSDNVLDGKDVQLTGGYTLKLASGIQGAKVTDSTLVPDEKSKTTAILRGKVSSGGYALSTDGKSVFYTPKGDGTTLATITGLKSGLTAEQLAEGITTNGNTITLKESVLGGTKITVSGGNYTLALDDQVKKEAVKTTDWVTNGTTATYKTYMCGYYTPDAKGTTIKYTKPTAGTTHATVKGIKSGADLNSVWSGSSTGGTLTLGTDQLGTSKVTISGKNFKVALNSGVQQTANTALEWVVSGTTATYTNHVQAYYTESGSTITYHAPTKGTVRATVSGIKSGLENFGKYVSDSNVITLGEDQLNQKKVTVSGDGYTLQLGDVSSENKATSLGTYWTQAKGKTDALYKEDFSKGYKLADDAKSISYSAKETTETLATVSGLTKATDNITTKTDADEDGKYEYYENFDDGTISVNKETKTITVTDSTAFPVQSDGTIKNGAKLTLKSDKYKLVMGSELNVPATEDANWLIGTKGGKANGTLIYQQPKSNGFTLSEDAKTLTYSAETTESLATISGLDKTKLADLLESSENSTIDADTLKDDYGISVDGTVIKLTKADDSLLTTSDITLDKNTAYSLEASSDLAPEAAGKKWTVSKTKATYSESHTDGYTGSSTSPKKVTYVKAGLGNTIFTINGIKNGTKVSNDGTKIGVYNSTAKDVTGSAISFSGKSVNLNKDVLSTTNVTLTNADGQDYYFGQPGGVSAPSSDDGWTYSKGTATYKKSNTSGYTLEDSAMPTIITYTAAKSTAIATVSGLNKTFTGLVDGSLHIDSATETITVDEELLGTTGVTLTVPKGGTQYSLVISDKLMQTDDTTKWVTSGTTAVYKTYKPAYYTINPNNGSIVYHKATAGTTHATITGIKSGATITSDQFSGGKDGGTITLSKEQLGTSNVAVSVPKGSKSTFTLALGSNAPTAEQKNVTEWVTDSKGTAVYKTYDKGYYTYDSSKNTITYTKGTNDTGTQYATIAGASSDVEATLKDGTFYVSGTQLSNKVTITGQATVGSGDDAVVSAHAFRFTDYNNSAIVGSKYDDSITTTGDGLTITGGKGDDRIDLGNASRQGNVIVYASGDGDDTIVNFQAGDSLKITGTTAVSANDDGDVVVSVTKGKVTGSITLQNCTLGEITINGTSYKTVVSGEDVLFADNNYSSDVAQLSSIVNADSGSYTP